MATGVPAAELRPVEVTPWWHHHRAAGQWPRNRDSGARSVGSPITTAFSRELMHPVTSGSPHFLKSPGPNCLSPEQGQGRWIGNALIPALLMCTHVEVLRHVESRHRSPKALRVRPPWSSEEAEGAVHLLNRHPKSQAVSLRMHRFAECLSPSQQVGGELTTHGWKLETASGMGSFFQ